jgi:hypothetical protein
MTTKSAKHNLNSAATSAPRYTVLTTPDDPSDDQNTTRRTWQHWMNTVDVWWPGDDTHNFLDDIWRVHLAILIAKVESCLSCCITCLAVGDPLKMLVMTCSDCRIVPKYSCLDVKGGAVYGTICWYTFTNGACLVQKCPWSIYFARVW